MPNRTIEFHDSTLDSISTSGSTTTLHFSAAYVHESEGRPGWDAGSGWAQEARLIVTGAQVNGALAEYPCSLLDGVLHLDGELFQMIPIPLEHCGRVEVKLEYMGELHLTGAAIRLELIGDPVYVEQVPGRADTEAD